MTILYISILVGFLVGCVGAALYSRVPGSLRLMTFYAFGSSAADIIGFLTASRTSSNHIYFNIYIIIDFLLMLFALKDLLGRNFRWITLIESVIFAGVYGLDLWYHGPNYLLMMAMVTSWALLAINCLIALYRTMVHPDPRTAAGIYLITGLNLLYFCCVIPRFGLHKFLGAISASMSGVLHSITVVIDIARFLGIAAGLILLAKRSPRPQLSPEAAAEKFDS